MKLYLAAVYTNEYFPGQARYKEENELEQSFMQHLAKDGNILESFHYVHKDKFVNAMRENNARIFLDSGAFSAKSLGAEIDINDYIRYIKENEDIILKEDGALMASVLDGIGDPKATWQNQRFMEHYGVKPLPCFHYGEDTRYLDWYLANGYTYITLGGLVPVTTQAAIQWLDRIWNNHLVDGSGKPKVKVHAFGVTTIRIMERYPWYSVDSSSWIQSASFGSAFTARYGPIKVSESSPTVKDQGKHALNMTEMERKAICSYFEKDGFTLGRLSTSYQSRAVYNCLQYRELNQLLNDKKDLGTHFLARKTLF